ncbi:MAG: glycosyltransferase family 2 protein [Christensenellaceae bacterium]|nr:glycosyltransferase family 2 protein [Christensenellaceae bacterium]
MIDILLATYNGEKYIEEQIESIFKQTYTDWKLIIRDDGSNDLTPKILDSLEENHPDKITVVRDADKNLGCIGNFSRLMTLSDADYMMFCDQDDVWLSDKIQLTLEEMKRVEKEGKPALVHSDLTVTDAELMPVAASFVAGCAYSPLPKTAAGLFLGNSVTGCTVMINRTLRELAQQIPKGALMHDQYLAILALSFGSMGYVDTPLELYRQHGSNVCGANRSSVSEKLKKMLSIKNWKAAIARTGVEVNKNFDQVKLIYNNYSGIMSEDTKKLYEAALGIMDITPLKRTRILEKMGAMPLKKYEKTALKLYFMTQKQ